MLKFLQNLLSKLGYSIGLGLERNTPTLKQEMERRAVESSADYLVDNMSDAIMFLSHEELLNYAVGRSELKGYVLEFGVYKGNTLNYMADLVSRINSNKLLWGFDSFEGLPNDWSGYLITKETFDIKGKLPKTRKNVKLIKGFFDQSLPTWILEHGNQYKDISLLHIDSDLYESCKVILDNLNAYIRPGTFILFDEYFNYPNWQKHEFLAFKEYCEMNHIKYIYRGYFEQKVLVEIIQNNSIA